MHGKGKKSQKIQQPIKIIRVVVQLQFLLFFVELC